MKYAYKKLIWILALIALFAFFTINNYYIMNQLTHPIKGIRKQIADTQDRIKSLNTELSRWKNETNMTQEAKKLKLRKAQEGEIVILENETDS